MFPSTTFSGFCVFCYQSIYVCAKATSSSETVNKFTKFVDELTGHKDLEKILAGDCKSGKLRDSNLQCCHDCNAIINGFCSYYHQLKVMELQMNWKLEQIAEVIGHCNRVPSRWTKMNACLENVIPDDLKMRLKSQTFIRKYRQYIEKICRQRNHPQQPRVLLEKNQDFATNSNIARPFRSPNFMEVDNVNDVITEDNRTSLFSPHPDIDEDMNDDNDLEYSDHEQSMPSPEPHFPVKLEDSTVSQVSDDVDIEIETSQHEFTDPSDSLENCIQIDADVLLPKTSVNKQQKYSFRNKRKSKALKLEVENSDHDESDAEFSPEQPHLELYSSDSNSNGGEYEDNDLDKPAPKSISRTAKRKHLKSESNTVKQTIKYGLECPTCKMYFIDNPTYKKHLNSSKSCSEEDYEKIGDWKCKECDLVCLTKKKLWFHRNVDHEEKICVKCGREFKFRQDLNMHSEYHQDPLECIHCSKQFQTKSGLRSHIKDVHDNINKSLTKMVNKSINEIPTSKKKLMRQEKEHLRAETAFKSIGMSTFTKLIYFHKLKNHSPDEMKERDGTSDESNLKVQWTCPRCQYKSTCCAEYQSHFAEAHFQIKNPQCRKLIRDKRCALCNMKFTTNEDLSIHFENVHKKSNFKCQKCGKTFSNNKYLTRHLRRHKNNKNLTFRPNKVISEQEQLGIDNFTKNCEICDRVLDSFGKKVKHLKEYHDLPGATDKSKHLNCQIDGCTAYFLTGGQLLYHRVAKHNYKLERRGISKGKDTKLESFQCPKCNKTFQSSMTYGRHKNSKFCAQNDDSGDTGNWKCEECDLIWNSKKELWVHQNDDHENVVCLEFGKIFDERKLLYKHSVFHMDPKDWEWECCKCGRKYSTRKSLKKHIEIVHGDNCRETLTNSIAKAKGSNIKLDSSNSKNFVTCKVCRKPFRNEQVYQNHLYSQVNGKFQCEFCPHIEKNVIKLSSHECQSHLDRSSEEIQSGNESKKLKWSCPRCQYQSSGCVDYQYHFAQAHFKVKNPKCVNLIKVKNCSGTIVEKERSEYKCTKCSKIFVSKNRLNRHIKQVHGKKTFTCEHCGLRFPFLFRLNTHLERTHKGKKNRPEYEDL